MTKYIALVGFSVNGRGFAQGAEVDVKDIGPDKIQTLVNMRRMLPEDHPDVARFIEKAPKKRNRDGDDDGITAVSKPIRGLPE